MIKILEDLEGFVSGQFDALKNLLTLFKLEAKLAGLSVFPLLVNVCLLFVILISWWLSLMMLVAWLVWYMSGSLPIMIVVLLLINSGGLFGAFRYLVFNLKSMSFEKTRMYLAGKGSDYAESQKKIDCKN